MPLCFISWWWWSILKWANTTGKLWQVIWRSAMRTMRKYTLKHDSCFSLPSFLPNSLSLLVSCLHRSHNGAITTTCKGKTTMQWRKGGLPAEMELVCSTIFCFQSFFYINIHLNFFYNTISFTNSTWHLKSISNWLSWCYHAQNSHLISGGLSQPKVWITPIQQSLEKTEYEFFQTFHSHQDGCRSSISIIETFCLRHSACLYEQSWNTCGWLQVNNGQVDAWNQKDGHSLPDQST